MTAPPGSRLKRLFRPASIAFVGGTQIGGAIRACRAAGYAGEMWVVNPNAGEIEGIACIPSIEALPSAPDAALVGLSPARSIAAVEALAAQGAGGAAVVASGFAETGADGRALQEALKSAAGEMPVLGPNCMGLLNQFDGAAIWADDTLTERPEGPAAAIISQSGAMLIGIVGVEQGFPLGYAVSVGNQAVTDMAECIHAVLDDERITAVGLYLEGINDGALLGKACLAARSKGVPVVALKGGDQEAGGRVALSHTASMLVERDIWHAFCERFAIVEASSPKALVETLKLLTIAGVPKGNRVAVLSYSGGVNGLVAAQAGPLGLDLPTPADDSQARLRDMLPPGLPLSNPMDLNIPFRSKNGISLEDRGAVANAIETFARGMADQISFLIDIPRPTDEGLDAVWAESVAVMTDVARDLQLPCSVAGILPEGLPHAFRKRLIAGGVAPLLGLSETLEALSLSIRVAGMQAHTGPPATASLYTGTEPQGAVMLDEATSKTLLAGLGLAVPEFETVTPDQAPQAANRLGYPLAVKLLSDRIAHKATVGGVHLHLTTPETVAEACQRISTDVGTAPNGHAVSHVLLERMIDDVAAEIIVGIKRHPTLGLAMMIGRGGTAVERLGIYETLLLPLDHDELDRVLERLGFAGHVGLTAAARAIAGFADAHSDDLVTLDVNPLMLTGDGKAIAADALIVMADNAGKSNSQTPDATHRDLETGGQAI